MDRQLEYARNDGESAALLFQRYPSWRMKLRSGLHPLNYIRSGILTASPFRKAYEKYLNEKPEGRLAGLASSLLTEREYLQRGRALLKSGTHNEGEKS